MISRRSLLLAGAAFPVAARAQCVTDTPAVDACRGGVRITAQGPPGATLDLSFMTPGTLDPRITFTRASIGTYFDVAGVLQVAAYNLIRNNTQAGAVVGTPGTLPTTWTISAADGLTTNVVYAGADYIDLRVFGTPNGTTYSLWIDNIATTNGLSYVLSGSTATVGGSQTNITQLRLLAGGTGGAGVNWNTTPTLTRGSATWTSAGAAVQAQITFTTVISSPVDITLRLALAQIEQASVMSAVPTPTAGAANGAPRWDYDPVTHALRGLLIEEQRINAFFQSGDFTSASWIKGSSTLGAAILAPNGATVGSGLVSNSGVIGYLAQSATVVAGTTYTLSCFMKSGSLTSAVILMPASLWIDATNRTAVFNLAAGTVTSTSGGTATAAISPAGNGWYRCSLTATPDVSTSTPVHVSRANGNGDGVTIQHYAFGAQLETGAFATSYIPTTAAAVTRSADVATMPGPFINQPAGSIVAEFMVTGRTTLPAGVFTNSLEIDDGSGNNVYTTRLFGAGATANGVCFAAGSNVGSAITVNSWAPDVPTKHGLTYVAGTTITTCMNGAAVASIALTATPATLNRVWLGAGRTNNMLDGCLRRVQYWPRALTNAELQQVTT